jgi:predicted ferric reductase
MNQQTYQTDLEKKPAVSLITVAVSTLAVIVAVDAALILLPLWIPGMVDSISGENAKVYWYLSRGSAVSAYILLWASMALGLLMTNKMSRYWPGAPAAYDLHQYVSLLGMVFVIFHALILTGDSFIKISLFQALLPFGSENYRPIQVALGQVGFYLWIILVGTFYVKKQISTKTWRLIHFASFLMFLFAMIHGITSGTDTSSNWMQVIYWGSGASLLFLTIYRVLMAAANRLFPAGQKTTSTAQLIK